LYQERGESGEVTPLNDNQVPARVFFARGARVSNVPVGRPDDHQRQQSSHQHMGQPRQDNGIIPVIYDQFVPKPVLSLEDPPVPKNQSATGRLNVGTDAPLTAHGEPKQQVCLYSFENYLIFKASHAVRQDRNDTRCFESPQCVATCKDPNPPPLLGPQVLAAGKDYIAMTRRFPRRRQGLPSSSAAPRTLHRGL